MKDRALPGTGGEHRQTQLRRWLHGISTDAPGQFVHRIALTGVTPSDTEEERVKKATLTLSTMLITPLSLVWTAVYASLHLWIPALIPFLYFLASGTTLVYFFRSLRYRWFRELQLGLMLLLPFCLQWSLGGYRASSAVSIWAFASPLGALMFSGIRRSRPWFAGFVDPANGSHVIGGRS